MADPKSALSSVFYNFRFAVFEAAAGENLDILRVESVDALSSGFSVQHTKLVRALSPDRPTLQGHLAGISLLYIVVYTDDSGETFKLYELKIGSWTPAGLSLATDSSEVLEDAICIHAPPMIVSSHDLVSPGVGEMPQWVIPINDDRYAALQALSVAQIQKLARTREEDGAC